MYNSKLRWQRLAGRYHRLLVKQKRFGAVLVRRAFLNPLPTLARQLEMVCWIYERDLEIRSGLPNDD